ncbi:hypothetical protein BD309DRAFT_974155 [Dichomitus squalens]|nr:hypothetical protein BD309DRAFT_974155 [Dichomitus squalens]
MGGGARMFVLHSAGTFSPSAASEQGVFALYADDRLTISSSTVERAGCMAPSLQTTWRWCFASTCWNGFSSRRSPPALFLPTFRRARWNAHRDASSWDLTWRMTRISWFPRPLRS